MKFEVARARVASLCLPEHRKALAKAFALSAHDFSEPARHYHHQALARAWHDDIHVVADALYAMLLAWGMNRTGPTGPKMRGISHLVHSLTDVRPSLEALRHKAPQHLTPQDWETLESAFGKLDVMQTGSKLVAHSKVLAHLLPTLIGPIDRSYTCRFLFESTNLPQTKEGQWKRFRQVHEAFYHPLLTSEVVTACAADYLQPPEADSWHTSPIKFIDNIVLAIVKMD